MSALSDDDGWLERFDRRHRELALPGLYSVAVLMLVTGTVGLFWTLPIPEAFRGISPLLNWGSAFLMATTVYYFIISLSLAFGLLPFVIALAAIERWLSNSGYPELHISLSLLFVGIVGIAVSQQRGSGLRGVLRDLQHMMIAPAWMLSLVYRRIGIPV